MTTTATIMTPKDGKEILTGKRRMASLARPKPLPAGFQEDWRTCYYWTDKVQKDWDGGDVSTKHNLTERQKQLVQPRGWHREWQGDRPTPIWQVSTAAQTTQPTRRLDFLAQPKAYAKAWEPDNSVYSHVSDAARKAEPSYRIEVLAQHKVYPELTDCDPDLLWDWGVGGTDISLAALKCQASNRVQQLALPKITDRQYKKPRNVEWTVPLAAKKTIPTNRIQQLARPKSKSMYKEDYNPSWWRVSAGAKIAEPTDRLSELVTPLARKQRQKKGGKPQ